MVEVPFVRPLDDINHAGSLCRGGSTTLEERGPSRARTDARTFST